jgi:hypothetical protein
MAKFARRMTSFVCVMMCVVSLCNFAAAQAPGPTAEHKLLQGEVGTWNAKMKLFHTPGAEPSVSDATETIELGPGGLWILSKFEGEIMGMPFTGHGATGYDPVKKKYVGTWVDGMSPNLMITEGEYDPATKTTTSFAEGRDPASGATIKYKQISRTIDENTRTFEMLQPGEGGEFVKMMEIEYTRKK